MIFQHTIANVLNGTKTQTRRLVKPGQEISAANTCIYAYHPYRIYVEVGHTYAAQPGRTQKAVARIRITRIRQEDVRDISAEDVKAEGFEAHKFFWFTWCGMHDPGLIVTNIVQGGRDYLMTRPAERYLAWVLDFELVTP